MTPGPIGKKVNVIKSVKAVLNVERRNKNVQTNKLVKILNDCTKKLLFHCR